MTARELELSKEFPVRVSVFEHLLGMFLAFFPYLSLFLPFFSFFITSKYRLILASVPSLRGIDHCHKSYEFLRCDAFARTRHGYKDEGRELPGARPPTLLLHRMTVSLTLSRLQAGIPSRLPSHGNENLTALSSDVESSSPKADGCGSYKRKRKQNKNTNKRKTTDVTKS